MDKKVALLIEVTSIQRYVFSVNLLKASVGASNIVDTVFKDELKDAIEKVIRGYFNINAWEESGDIVNSPVDIGYTGGGNALIFTDALDYARSVVKTFSTFLLQSAPGLRCVYAIKEDFDLKDFKNSLSELFKELGKNKQTIYLENRLQKFGINADCPYTHEVAEDYYDNDKQAYTSLTFKSITKRRKTNFLEELGDFCDKKNFSLTEDVEKFGQREGNNYIAVIHIDGNRMGEKKASFENLEELRRFSLNTDRATKESFKEMTENMVNLIEKKGLPDDKFNLKDDNGKSYLPLRPVIIGGDDVTFISHGALGMYLAEKFIEIATKKIKSYSQFSITFSAGVAIVKTKYPIYRAYELAEDLCYRCKKMLRKQDLIERYSAIDYLIATHSTTKDAKKYLLKAKTIGDKELHFGPYLIGSDCAQNERSIEHLKKSIKNSLKDSSIKGLSSWNRNKLMQFRSLLTKGADVDEIDLFLKSNGLKLPEYEKAAYQSKIFIDNKTPYYDVIELIDFYPENLIGEG